MSTLNLDKIKEALNAGLDVCRNCKLNTTYHERVLKEALKEIEENVKLAPLLDIDDPESVKQWTEKFLVFSDCLELIDLKNRIIGDVGGFLDKITEVHDSEAYKSVWTVAQMHIGQYNGPKYTEELNKIIKLVEDCRSKK